MLQTLALKLQSGPLIDTALESLQQIEAAAQDLDVAVTDKLEVGIAALRSAKGEYMNKKSCSLFTQHVKVRSAKGANCVVLIAEHNSRWSTSCWS